MRAHRNFDHEQKNDYERKKFPLAIITSDHRQEPLIFIKILFSINQKFTIPIIP